MMAADGAGRHSGRRPRTAEPGQGAGTEIDRLVGPRVETLTDAQLLAAHAAGDDPRAFDELAQRHRGQLWAVAYDILRHPQDADDAVQEAMLRASRHAKGYCGRASVYIWLRKITINQSTSIAAQRTRLASRVSDQDPSNQHDRGAVNARTTIELDELLRQVLAELPEHQRTAFVLVQLLDMPVEDVAGLQLVHPTTVYTRIYRARQHLVERLDYRQVIDLLRRIDA